MQPVAEGPIVPHDRLSRATLENGLEVLVLEAERVGTRAVHGAGCTLSAALAALLARGEALREAARRAKAYVGRCLERAPALGSGAVPLAHFPPGLDGA